MPYPPIDVRFSALSSIPNLLSGCSKNSVEIIIFL
jgi:hypothetical protein